MRNGPWGPFDAALASGLGAVHQFFRSVDEKIDAFRSDTSIRRDVAIMGALFVVLFLICLLGILTPGG